MGNVGYILMVILGILVCAALSIFVLFEFLKVFDDKDKITFTNTPPPEVVAAITATLSAILGEPTYSFVIKGISQERGGQNA